MLILYKLYTFEAARRISSQMRRHRVDAKIGEAVSFVMEVKHVFQDRREKYDEFLKILDDFSAERID